MGNSVMSIFGREGRVKLIPGQAEYKFVLQEQLMGVEIEAELNSTGSVLFPRQQDLGNLWEIKTDGSLISGREFVLARPMEGDELSTAISRFFATARLDSAVTSSTHIHLDMSEETTTLNVLQVVFALVYMLEPVLWHVGDPSRKWCGFTHPINTVGRDILEQLFSEDFNIKAEEFADATRNVSRYYGLNVNALYKYGSLEFRYFPTATTAPQLVSWINLVQSFKKAAQEIESMRTLAASLESEDSYNAMIGKYFDEWKSIILDHVPHRVASSAFYELTEVHHGNRVSVNYGRVLKSNTGFAKIGKKRKAPAKKKLQQDNEPVGIAMPNGTSLASLPNLTASNNVVNEMIDSRMSLARLESTVVVNYPLLNVHTPTNVSETNNAIILFQNQLYVGASNPVIGSHWLCLTDGTNDEESSPSRAALINAYVYLERLGLSAESTAIARQRLASLLINL